MKNRILVVEDELHIAQALIFNLEQEGYSVHHTETGEEALALLESGEFDLVVLDLMLPGISGFDVCQKIRERWERLPVLILTAKGEPQDKVAGLAMGADDYLTKPFSLDEFLIRIAGILKRSGWYRPDLGPEITFGGNLVNLGNGKAKSIHGDLDLTEQELKLFQVFVEHHDEVIERGPLLQRAWGVDPGTETRTLDNFVARLRKYFEPNPSEPRHFQTIRGKGYCFRLNPDKTFE
ncbi:MAG: DNA-binding response regulator [Desulfuromonas sp.]|nr:MAG: DNA-binding response regulator [Desulfuromonas sp.]